MYSVHLPVNESVYVECCLLTARKHMKRQCDKGEPGPESKRTCLDSAQGERFGQVVIRHHLVFF